MTNQFRQPVQAVVFLLVLASVLFSTGSLRAQGFSKIPPPPGTVSLLQKQDRGLTHFFVDSTLFEVRLNRLRRDTRLDSSQQLLVVEEKYFDDDYRLPAAVDLAYYQKLRLEEDVRNLWTRSVLEHIEYGNRSGAAGIELNIPLRIKNNAFRRIFGGDRVGLVVSGNITFELAGRTESREGSAISSIDQRNNFAPKFKQTQQFRVEGRVGDKVTVSVDQNSEATFDFENTLKLTYEGDEDEIVQRIEAGNVALNLPSTNYVSASQNHQGLFGLKTEMQVGKLSFTGIASLERGENQTLSVTGSSNENTRNIKDTEYVRNQFFFVDDYYQEHFEGDLITQNMQLTVSLDRKVRQLDVWKTVNVAGGNGRTNSFHAVAVLDPAVYDQNRGVLDTLSTRNGYVHEGQFERLTEGEDYEVDYLRGYFRMKSRVDENSEVLAVSYSYGPDANIENVGDLAQDIQANLTDSTIVLLRLIKPQGNQPTYPTWPLTMRNVYNLGGAVTADGFETRVIYTKEGNDDEVDDNGRTYNFLMGLDRVDEQGAIAEGGDKKVDLGKSFIFNLQDGYLVFPSLTPFSPGLFPSSGANVFTDFPDAQRVEIYDIKDNTEELKRSKFAIEVTTTSSSSTFDLGFNVLEGSETVRLNGAILQRDKDYIIDYFSGRLEITDPEARRADAKVDIEYERGALFQLDKKTLLGGRLAYEFRETDFVALTTMFYSKSTLDQRVRLGQEPIRNFIWDLNTALNFKPNFLTKVLDALPVVETQAESKLRIEAEYAQVNPNPNTFNEEELGDKDGVAYIDDFEGSKRTTTLGIQYRVWTGSSVPVRFTRINSPNKGHLAPSGGPALKDYILNQDANRVDFNWYNPFDDVPIRSIFPNRDVNSQTGTTTKVLNLRWQNDDVDADSAWAGIMRSTLTFADQQKTKFLELWVRGETGQVNIDIGSISEDFYVKGQYPNPDVAGDFLDSYQGLNTEDVNFNGLLEDDEDVGIDGVPGADGQNVPNDAGNDDFRALQQDDPNVAGINGTEGNSQIQGARYPDTEDLNGDGGLTTLNDYFAYSFDLSQEEYLVSRTRDPESGELTGWKQYRIPLDDFRFKIGNPNPNFQEIYYVRLWLNDLQPDGQQHNMQIAAFDFVGNEWEEEGLYTANGQGPTLDDDKFSITVYNTEEHADPPVSYQSPPGVEGIKDRITQAVSKEQSLVMEIKDLGPGMRAEARKQLRERINLLNYQRLKMFMYGRNIDAASQPDTVMFYMRFGPTDQIYYEYRQPVYEGWNNNDVEIDFGELTDTKQDQYLNLDSTRIGVPASNAERDVFYRRTSDGREFIVVGQPGLHNIDYLIFGALNTSTMSSVTDDETTKHEIWLDELRVTGVERNSGSAMRLSMNLDAGGVFNVRGNWELKDADFRRLEDQFASTDGKDKTVQKQSYNFKIGLHKLLPSSWNLNIPLFMQYNRSLEVPKYYYNSD
nr:cell surface protein SprA [Calditrichia bacterium]